MNQIDSKQVPLSLYVHIPWCVQKCPYCDFNSHALKDEMAEDEYINTLLEDLACDLARFPSAKARKLSSIFIGGGTPSLFKPASIKKLLDAVQSQIPFTKDTEITMEANPGTLEANLFSGFKNAGVNRLSIGVQSFNNEHLAKLGRIHNSKEAANAIMQAKNADFQSLNLDLMHGLPNQSLEHAMTDLKQAIALSPTHLSWYQLTIEPNTLYYSNPPRLPEDDLLWQIFAEGRELLKAAGYEQYETSGYSKAEFQCRHNLNYWRFGDYLGIGCGAHGKITQDNQVIRTVKVKHPRGYLDKEKDFLTDIHSVALDEMAFEFFMNRFRLTEPCPKSEFEALTGLSLESIEKPINKAIESGYLQQTSTDWQVTKKGRLFLNDLLSEFL